MMKYIYWNMMCSRLIVICMEVSIDIIMYII